MKSFHSFKHDDVVGLEFGYHPFHKPSLRVHLYYVDGLLIDTGQKHCRKLIVEQTKNLNIQQIFITHHHEDHTGNITVLSKHHQCEVLTTDKCLQVMNQPPRISLAQKMIWGDRPANSQMTTIEGVLRTPNFEFELIQVPGHAGDMTVLYERKKKWLFSADLYIHSYIGYMLKYESIEQQINSIKKILKLDFEVLFCAHNPKLHNGKEALEKKLHFLTTFYQQVTYYHRKGMNASQIMKAMKLKENYYIKYLSGGMLSKMNMVKSVLTSLDVSKIT